MVKSEIDFLLYIFGGYMVEIEAVEVCKGNAYGQRKRKDFPSKWFGKPRFGKHTDFYSRINEMKIVRSECRDAFHY